MKKWKEKWSRLSRVKQLVCYLLLLAVITFCTYLLAGSPALTARMAFRRSEKANMVGPGTILAEFQQDTLMPYRNVIVAETNQTYMLCALRPDKPDINHFVCYQRNGNMALYHLPGSMQRIDLMGDPEPLTLILFDEEATAVRAELELECPHPYEEGRTIPMTGQAQRQYGGFFLFHLYTDYDKGPVDQALTELMYTCSSGNYYKQPVTIRLYDRNDELIRTETFLAGPRNDQSIDHS